MIKNWTTRRKHQPAMTNLGSVAMTRNQPGRLIQVVHDCRRGRGPSQQIDLQPLLHLSAEQTNGGGLNDPANINRLTGISPRMACDQGLHP
jgi:hypothetical protein